MSKDYYINTLRLDEEIKDFFVIKNISVKTGSNGKDYLDLTLGDCSGEVNGKKWDLSESEYSMVSKMHEGDVIKIIAGVSEWNGQKQLRISRIRPLSEADEVDMTELIKAAPEDPKEMYDFLFSRAESIKDEALRSLTQNALSENHDRLIYYPGAARNHHAEYAGLLYHMTRMLRMGIRACEVYQNLDPDWIICGVIMHDMEKLNEIVANESGVASGYSMKGKLLGHLVMGAIEIEERGKRAGLSEEKIAMLQHMSISHHYEPDFGSPIKPLFPEAEMLHYLDMMDAKMFDFEDALKEVAPGEFSERVRTLDNRALYKPSFK